MASSAGRDLRQVPVTTLGNGHHLSLSVHTVEGARPGPRMVLFGGIHGDEPMGSETVRRLVESIDPAELSGTVVAVPVANPYSYEAGTRHTPQDGLNLNRIFPGDRRGSLTEQLAAVLVEILDGADHFIDFHSGGTHPTVEYAYIHRAGAEMSRAYGCTLLYHHEAYEGSATGWALENGIACMVSELGGGGQRTGEYLDRGVAGGLNVLRTLGMLTGEPTPPPADQYVVTTLSVLRPTVGGALLSEFPTASLLGEIDKDTVLGRVVDPHTFETLETITAPYQPTVLVLTREPFTRVWPGDYGFMVADGATRRQDLPS